MQGKLAKGIYLIGSSRAKCILSHFGWQILFKQNNTKPFSKEQEAEYQNLFFGKVESWLDNCYGKYILAEPECAKVVKDALEYFNQMRYILDHWVIMPNHVHVLALILEGSDLTKILHSWKSFTAKKINSLTNSEGQLWQHESFDHIVRSQYHLEKYRAYIISNKNQAGSKAISGNSIAKID